MRTRTSGNYYFVIVPGAAKVCFMELWDSAKVYEAHFCFALFFAGAVMRTCAKSLCADGISGIKLIVAPLLLEKLLVRAPFNDPSMLEDHDTVGIAYG